MRRILEELWHGNINPQDKQFQRGTEYDETLKCLNKNESKLNTMLESKELEIFEKYRDCKEELEHFDEEDAFVAGFRLGAKMIIEALCENDGFFTDITE